MDWEEIDSLIGSIRTRSLVARPTSLEQCRETLAWCRQYDFSVCPRGSGRSYGDIALNDRQVLLDMSANDRILDFDEQGGRIRVEAGTRLIQIFEAVHHRKLTLAASPTESNSTVGGAIGTNVNGKDGWRLGQFGDQVVRFTLMTGDGRVHEIDRSHELFAAVVGGMGMLGIVLEATLQLRPIPSPWVAIRRLPARDVDELLERLAEVESSSDFLVAWMDAYARGASAGRAVVHAASWIASDASQAEEKAAVAAGIERLAAHRRFGLALHALLAPFISLMLQAQRLAVRAFNRFYYAKSRAEWRAGRHTGSELFLKFSFEASFTVPPAHLVCGPHGFTLQLSFPRTRAREAILEMLEIWQASPCPPVTVVLRAHRSDEHVVSLGTDGYSLNLEFHPKRRHRAAMRACADRLIDATARHGGRVHMAKDQVLGADQFRRVFPKHVELLDLKRRLDPAGRFRSDMAARLGLCSRPPAPEPDRSGAPSDPRSLA